MHGTDGLRPAKGSTKIKILVTGAGGVVGHALIHGFRNDNREIIAAGRNKSEPGWVSWDMEDTAEPPVPGVHFLIHAAPLWLLPRHLPSLFGNGLERMVCFSSSSVLSKKQSVHAGERQIAFKLQQAEEKILKISEDLGVCATIFRPTLIYGYGRDKNITTIAKFIRKYRFFPVSGRATGKRMPLHAEEAARASINVLGNDKACQQTYTLAGGEVVTYHEMVVRIFEALQYRKRILHVPEIIYKTILDVSAHVRDGINGAMAVRMNQDLVFDNGKAFRDFEFKPRAFELDVNRDLG